MSIENIAAALKQFSVSQQDQADENVNQVHDPANVTHQAQQQTLHQKQQQTSCLTAPSTSCSSPHCYPLVRNISKSNGALNAPVSSCNKIQADLALTSPSYVGADISMPAKLATSAAAAKFPFHHHQSQTSSSSATTPGTPPPTSVPFTNYEEEAAKEVRLSRKRCSPMPEPLLVGDNRRHHMYQTEKYMPVIESHSSAMASPRSDNVFMENNVLISQTLQGRAHGVGNSLPAACSMRSVQRAAEYPLDEMPTGVLKWSSSHSSYGYATQDNRERISENTTESVRVDSSFHVAEIVGKQGAKIKKIRADTNTWIKTPARGEEPVFTISGRPEGVGEAKAIIIASAEKVARLRALRHSRGLAGAGEEDPTINTDGSVVLKVSVPSNTVGLVIGPKGNRIREIAEATNTYIKTPSRYREPVFEMFGHPHDVQMAKEQILAFIHEKKEEEFIRNLMCDLPIHEPGSPVKLAPAQAAPPIPAMPLQAANTNYTRLRPYSPHLVSPMTSVSPVQPSAHMFSDLAPHYPPNIPMYSSAYGAHGAAGVPGHHGAPGVPGHMTPSSRYPPTIPTSSQSGHYDLFSSAQPPQRVVSLTPPGLVTSQHMPTTSSSCGQLSPRYYNRPHM